MAQNNPQKASAEDQELIALFADLDTPGVSDALDKLGLHGQVLGIQPLADYKGVVVGPAFTVRYVRPRCLPAPLATSSTMSPKAMSS